MAQSQTKTKTTSHLVAGFSGGLTSAVLLQPFDLLKTRLQQQSYQNGNSIIKEIRSLTKLSELWRGTVPSALRTSIGSGLYLTCLSHSRTYLALLHSQKTTPLLKTIQSSSSSTLPKLSMYENLLTGAIIRSFVGFLTMPITVMKVRYESNLYNYNSLLHATTSIYQQGGIKEFFKGFGATVLRDAPYAGLYVLFYEQLKVTIPAMFGMEGRAGNGNEVAISSYYNTSKSALINSSAAFLSAAISTTLTAPFDTIKTRLQLSPDKYKNFVQTFKVIVSEERIKNLFDGLSLRLVRKGFSAGISWCIYEELIKLNFI